MPGRGNRRGRSARITVERNPDNTGVPGNQQQAGLPTVEEQQAGHLQSGHQQACHQQNQVDQQGSSGSGDIPSQPQQQQLLSVFREELKRSLEVTSNEITSRFKGRFSYLERKVENKAKPEFKSKWNAKHFNRGCRYLDFILETRSAIVEGDVDDALTTLDAFEQAVKSYQKDVQVADKYKSGWTLVDRYNGEDDEDPELRKLNDKILEERAKKRKGDKPGRGSGPEFWNRSEVWNRPDVWEAQGGNQSFTQPEQRRPGPVSHKPFGPCIWCSQFGHGYKVNCRFSNFARLSISITRICQSCQKLRQFKANNS